ncbi:MAG TPA: hypothetical protein VHV78_09225 [Gemmatimonadaceae bacterium]|nr:hypothetical protein [Gemmatimonadaceae bacterium]
MTVADWLGTRTPAPPPALASRIAEALANHGMRDESDTDIACVDAAEPLLRDLLARPSAGRESALDLLSVDALVTYAFEAASSSPGGLAERASTAMRRFAQAAFA